ncbi:hypothetical protein VNO78_27077 [Psophocarpus tetragonolobus]|uniref:Uncharacterized protein n=1 Tax=Psophocarpus tetragonolobus TaxID=3891 RepID=A0AAN9XA07_PSOTE
MEASIVEKAERDSKIDVPSAMAKSIWPAKKGWSLFRMHKRDFRRQNSDNSKVKKHVEGIEILNHWL